MRWTFRTTPDDITGLGQEASTARAPIPWHEWGVGLIVLILGGMWLVSNPPERSQEESSAHELLLANWKAHEVAADALAFSPDGSTLVTGGMDGSVGFWDPSTGRATRAPLWRAQGVPCVAYSPDGRLLAMARGDGGFELWDNARSETLGRYAREHGGLRAMVFLGDGKTLAVVGSSGTIGLWDVDLGDFRAQLTGHRGPVHSMSLAADGRTLVSGGHDGQVILWDTTTASVRSTLATNAPPILRVAISPDGARVAWSGRGKPAITVWNVARNSLETLLNGHDFWVTALTFDPRGGQIYSGSADHTVRIWTEDGRLVQTLPGSRRWVKNILISPGGQSLVTGGADGTVRVFRIPEIPPPLPQAASGTL